MSKEDEFEKIFKQFEGDPAFDVTKAAAAEFAKIMAPIFLAFVAEGLTASHAAIMSMTLMQTMGSSDFIPPQED